MILKLTICLEEQHSLLCLEDKEVNDGNHKAPVKNISSVAYSRERVINLRFEDYIIGKFQKLDDVCNPHAEYCEKRRPVKS